MAADQTSAPLKPGHLAAVTAGNALEFYDFLTYAFFAVHIGHSFFPADSQTALLKSLAIFGVGFFTRPLGGAIIGRLGDRWGRRPAMTLSFGLMGVSIVGLALTPSFAQIGIWAPVLAVLFRLLQGFALGGEVGPATAFLVEAAPAGHRGLVISLQSASQNLAILISSAVGIGLTALLAPRALDLYGWRIAFLIGAAVVPLGLWMRATLPETRDRPELPDAPAPPALRGVIIMGALLLISGTVQTYIQTYLVTYTVTSLSLPENLAFIASLIGAVAGLIVGPLVSYWSDRHGRRRPVLLYPSLIRLLVTLPLFWAMLHFRNGAALIGGTLVLAVLGAATPYAVVIAEALPRRQRSGAFGMLYAAIISLFGGTTQFVVQALIDHTGNKLAPAWYLTLALFLGTIAAAGFPETGWRAKPRK